MHYLRTVVRGVRVVLGLLLLAAPVAAQPPDPAPDPEGLPNIFYGAVPPSPPALAAPPVLVFVHGLSGTADNWWLQNNTYQKAYEFGYRTAFISLSPDNTRNTDPVNVNGERLTTWLPLIAARYNVSKLVLIGHSKGGVDLQAAMMVPEIRRLAAAVFTLATPNQGTELADWAYGEGQPIAQKLGLLSPGLYSLTLGVMAQLRATADPVFREAGIPFYTLEGSTSMGNPITLITGAVLKDLVPDEKNDGLVTVARARLSDEYASDLGEIRENHFVANNGDVVMPKIHSVLRSLSWTLDYLRRIQANGFGDPHNTWAWSTQWFQGHLYVGTGREITCVTTLTSDVQQGTNVYPIMAKAGGCPDLETLPSVLAAEIWRYDPATSEWARVFKSPETIPMGVDGAGQPLFTARDIGFRGMTTFIEPDGTEALYVGGVTSGSIYDLLPGFEEGYPPPRILRTTDGVNWQPLPQTPGTFLGDIGKADLEPDKTIRSIRSLTVYKGMLFATAGTFTGVARVIASANPAAGDDAWFFVSPSIREFPVWDQKVFAGRLYVTTGNKEEAERPGYGIYWTDATGPAPYKWNAVITEGGYQLDPTVRAPNGLSMAVFKDQLYVGTNRPTELVRVNANGTWDLLVGEPRLTPHGWKTPLTGLGVGFGSWFNGHFWRMTEHGGYLYLGTWDWSLWSRFLGEDLWNLFMSEYGFDLYRTTDGIHWEPVTRSGISGEMLNMGARSLLSTPVGMFVGSARSNGGTEVFHCSGDDCTVNGPPPAVAAPARLEAVSAETAGRTALLSWQPSPDAVRYRVYRATVRNIADFLPSPDGLVEIPGLPAPLSAQDILAGALDPLCGNETLAELCELVKKIATAEEPPAPPAAPPPSPTVLPEPFTQIATVSSTSFTEEAPTAFSSLYFVRAEDAQGRLSMPSNFVAGPSKRAAVPFDPTPPVMLATVSPDPNAAGWHSGPVTVTWSLGDPETSIAVSTGCEPTILTAETSGTTVTCSATNGDNQTATDAVTIRIALPPPSVAPRPWEPRANGLPELQAKVVASGLSFPMAFVQDPSHAHVQFVVEQLGRIRVLSSGALVSKDFLDLTGAIAAGGVSGLLGLAFAPDSAVSGRFFVSFTNPSGHLVIARFRRSAEDPFVADPASRFDLTWPDGNRFITQPFGGQHGGDLHFGSDGYLYVGLGDGGGANDPLHVAQDPSTLLGKMIRIDVSVPDSDPIGYVVPSDNPFAGQPGVLPEIWSFGLRNPVRFTVDALERGGNGAILIGDVGQDGWEEINYQPFLSGGQNYGWSSREGAHDNIPSPPPAFAPLVDPIVEYDHGNGTGVVGGVVDRGTSLGIPFFGRYFFGDLSRGRLWSVRVASSAGGGVRASDMTEHTGELGTSIGNISAFGVDASCRIHVVDWSGGQILRLNPKHGRFAASCAGLDPFLAMGGGVFTEFGWVPADHPLAQGGRAMCATPMPVPGWICINGDWIPPDHPAALGPSDDPPSSCATPSPGANWVCVNGNWFPPDHPGLGPSTCATPPPGIGWVCVNTWWVPPDHPLAKGAR